MSPPPQQALPDRTQPLSYVVYGTAPWDSPWLTEHNLADALARRASVLYVEPPVTPLSPIRYGLGHQTLGEARRLLTVGVRQERRVHVVTPLTVPPREGRRAARLGVPLVRAQLRRAARTARIERPVIVAARSVIPLLGALDERASVYVVKDLVHAGGHLLGKDSRQLLATQKAMCRAVDLVFAVSERLRSALAEWGVESTLLQHGFHEELAPVYDAAVVPPEYAALPRPIIGYAGRIDDRLDFAAIDATAARFGGGSLVLVGPISPRLPASRLEPLRARSNVHFLGVRRRTELPAYVRHLDCAVMPYRDDDWLRHASPLKLWDYLYAGPPVVGSGCLALANQPFVWFADVPAELPDAVHAALTAGVHDHAARCAWALANSWERRVGQLEDSVRARLYSA